MIAIRKEDASQLLGVPIESVDFETLLRVDSCLEWFAENTKLDIDKDNINESLAKLPSCARLFMLRYNKLYNRELGVTSESIGGMSQSFDTTAVYTQLWQMAYELLGEYLKSGFKVTPARKKWC